jgi:hypothetical protein
MLNAEKRVDEAIACFESARSAALTVLNAWPDDAEAVSALAASSSNLALALTSVGRLDEAIQVGQDLYIRLETACARHPSQTKLRLSLVQHAINLAFPLNRKQRSQEADALLTRAEP